MIQLMEGARAGAGCGPTFSPFPFPSSCLKRKSEKTKIARPKINNQKCPPCGATSNYRKSWAPRPQQLETPRLTLGKIRRETSLEPESVPQKYHCYQLWYSLLPGADTCLVSAPAQNCITDVESSLFLFSSFPFFSFSHFFARTCLQRMKIYENI